MTSSPRLLPGGAYQPALDGVRAIAVLAVIAYHLHEHLRGGFLGVDVFFVLSGFLITTLLLRERRKSGRISLPAFWARRARRLLPAVLLLVAVTAIITARITAVESITARRDDLISTIFYYANWHFIASDQSYFAASAGASPLRQMWSLAIEEQFYVVWPLVVAGLLALAGGRRRLLMGTALAGLVVSAVLMATRYSAEDPTRSYFGTDTRAHALLAGVLLAIALETRPAALTGERARRLATWAALPLAGAVAVAFLAVPDGASSYYHGGSLAFALTVAAALWTLQAAPRSLLGQVLSLRPVRWVGTISYGLYLWHWPLIIWIDDPRVHMNGTQKRLVEFVGAFAAATISYYVLERPVRTGRIPWLGASKLRLAIVAPITAGLVALLVVHETQLPVSAKVAHALRDSSDQPCPARSPIVDGTYYWCVKVPGPAGAPVVAAAGDSTSRALDPGMQLVARQRGWTYVQAGEDGCSLLPITLLATNLPGAVAQARACTVGIPRVLDQVRRREDPDVWVVADRILAGALVLPSGKRLAAGTPRHTAQVYPVLRRTLSGLTASGASVVIVAATPAGQPVRCTQTSSSPTCDNPGYRRSEPLSAQVDTMFRRVARSVPRVTVISVLDDLCPPGYRLCPPTVGGQLTRYDGVHLTSRYSRLLVPRIIDRARHAGVRFGARG